MSEDGRHPVRSRPPVGPNGLKLAKARAPLDAPDKAKAAARDACQAHRLHFDSNKSDASYCPLVRVVTWQILDDVLPMYRDAVLAISLTDAALFLVPHTCG